MPSTCMFLNYCVEKYVPHYSVFIINLGFQFCFFVQGGAEETHIFHIRVTLFIFNIKKF